MILKAKSAIFSPSRNPWLDVLRGMAILLVLFNHSDFRTSLGEVGWLGVDLFFVLSGYLISRLLFVEYQENKGIRLGRFMIRRSLRIMPAFYVFVLFSLAYAWLSQGHSFELGQILAELFYVQNYVKGIWVHTWSLAVEEQFYISFVLLVWLLIKIHGLNRPRLMVSLLLLSWLAVVLIKFRHVYTIEGAEPYFFVETHLRAEGIVLGVLLGYLHTFHPKVLKLDRTGQWLLFFFSCALMASVLPFHLAGPHLMHSWGMSLANLGFAGLVWLAVQMPSEASGNSLGLASRLIKVFGFVGLHSYAIYLWHLNVRGILRDLYPSNNQAYLIVYFAVAIGVGVVASLLIDQRVMRLRNRLWPKSTQP